MNELNIAEILQNAPKGISTRLYSTLFGECFLDKIMKNGIIRVRTVRETCYNYNSDGRYFEGYGECTLFPSSERTWEQWQYALFEKGCFVVEQRSAVTFLYDGACMVRDSKSRSISFAGELEAFRFATPEEANSFQIELIQNGFRYNDIEKKIELFLQPATAKIKFTVNSENSYEYDLTDRQYEVVKAVLDYITNKV